jgi:hypothetical protein
MGFQGVLGRQLLGRGYNIRFVVSMLLLTVIIVSIIAMPLLSSRVSNSLVTSEVTSGPSGSSSYKARGYRVFVRDLGASGSNDTILTIKLRDPSGKPPKAFIATLTGLKSGEGVVKDYISASGGSASKSIARFVSEAVRVTVEAGGNPSVDGPSIIVFLSALVEEDGTLYALADIATVPIVPGKVKGKEVILEWRISPIAKFKVNTTTSQTQSYSAPKSIDSLQPPRRIDDRCVPDWWYTACYYWEFNTTIATFYNERGHFMLTWLDSIDGDYVDWVIHTAKLRILQGVNTYVGIAIPVGVQFKDGKHELVYPGIGFQHTLPNGASGRVLLDVSCIYYNKKLVSSTGSCYWSDASGRLYRERHYADFYDEAVIGLGLRLNRIDYLHYVYVVEYWDIDGFYYREVLGDAIVVYGIPSQRSDGTLIHYTESDDNPYDGVGYPELSAWAALTSDLSKPTWHPLTDADYAYITYGSIAVSVDETGYASAQISQAPLKDRVIDAIAKKIPRLLATRLPRLIPVVGLVIDIGTYSYTAQVMDMIFQAHTIVPGSWVNDVYYYEGIRVKPANDALKDIPAVLYMPGFYSS